MFTIGRQESFCLSGIESMPQECFNWAEWNQASEESGKSHAGRLSYPIPWGTEAFYSQWDINELYRTYFRLVEELARSALFDIVGHFDRIKVFGYWPAGPVLNLAENSLQAIKAC
jgi:histidinol phosphatase-like PHP family hydrolase